MRCRRHVRLSMNSDSNNNSGNVVLILLLNKFYFYFYQNFTFTKMENFTFTKMENFTFTKMENSEGSVVDVVCGKAPISQNPQYLKIVQPYNRHQSAQWQRFCPNVFLSY